MKNKDKLRSGSASLENVGKRVSIAGADFYEVNFLMRTFCNAICKWLTWSGGLSLQ